MTFFADKMQELLKQRGLSVYALAKALDIHQQHVYKILNGSRRPTDEVLEKIAECGQLPVTAASLKGWRAVDDYTDDEIIEALRAIYPNVDKRKELLQSLMTD